MNSNEIMETISDVDLDARIAEAQRIEQDEARRRRLESSLPDLRQEQARRQQQQALEAQADQARTVLAELAPTLAEDIKENNRALIEALRNVDYILNRREALLRRYNNLESTAANALASLEWNGISTIENAQLDILRRYGLVNHPQQFTQEILALSAKVHITR